jgi:hypothetical protein
MGSKAYCRMVGRVVAPPYRSWRRVLGVALGLAVNADGRTRLKTVVLLTPEEIDQAAKMSVDYRPPGA